MPDADLLYSCDFDWWVAQDGAAGFAGLKVSQDERALRRYGVAYIRSVNRPGLSFDDSVIHTGYNSGFQALNLAVLLGCTEICLIGYDMHDGGGRHHFFGAHPQGLRNSRPEDFRQHFIPAFERAAPQLAAAGVRVLNATPGSALHCFESVDLEGFLNA